MHEFTIDEEDYELVQSIVNDIATLQSQYSEAFGLMAPQQQQGPE